LRIRRDLLPGRGLLVRAKGKVSQPLSVAEHANQETGGRGVTAAELDRICSSDDALSSGMDGPRDELLRQGLIDARVDLDLEYEREREVLRRSSLSAALKTRLLTKLKDQYRVRRQPYMQQLAAF
jgi:hypothetical protein